MLNSTKDVQERIGQLFEVRGKEQMAVKEVVAGDIGAVMKLTATLTGDTLCDPNDPIVLEGMEFPEPVASVAVHPKTREDEEKISNALQRLSLIHI